MTSNRPRGYSCSRRLWTVLSIVDSASHAGTTTLRCGRTARTRAGRGRLAEHSGELGALLRRELGLAAFDRAHSAHPEVGLQPLDLADLGLDPGDVHGIGAKQLGQIHLGHALVCVQLDRNLLKVAPDLLQLLDLG